MRALLCVTALVHAWTAARAANVSATLACGAATPEYAVLLNGLPMFSQPPPLKIFTRGAWEASFTLLRAQPEAGSDALGAFTGAVCEYGLASSSPSVAVVTLSVLTYPAVLVAPAASLVRFTYAFPSGLAGTAHGPPPAPAAAPDGESRMGGDDDDASAPPAASTVALFPAFTAPIPASQPATILTWAGSFMQPSTSFGDALGMAGGPVLYHGADPSGPSLLLSPLDQFLSSALGNDVGGAAPCNASMLGAAGCWAAGVSSTFTSLPPGFTGSWVLLAQDGITPLVATYGAVLASYYAETATKIADVSISGLSYTTDNGGQLTFGCPGQVLDSCLLAEAAYLKSIAAPIQMLSFQNAPMVARGESAPWCVSEFVPNAHKVPMGMQAFARAVGLPLQLYAPYLCNTTDYVQNYTMLRSNTSLPGCGSYDFYDPAPSSALEYFSFLMDLVLDYGGTLFEPDFLHQNHLCVDEFIQTVGAAEAVFGGMASAAQDRGIAIQFCFATPHVILWTLTTPSITNARVSYDFFYGGSWDTGVSSLMAWAAGSAPSKDTLWSSDNGAQATTRGACAKTGCPPDHSNTGAVLHTMLAVLSTGPVGYSDAPNETDITLVMRTCDAAGNLLQPSRPLVAVDSTHDGNGGAPSGGYVLGTHTEVYGTSPTPSMHYLLSHHLTSPFAVRGLDVWPRLTPGATYAVASNWSALRTCTNGSAAGACGVADMQAPPSLASTLTTLAPESDPFSPLLTLIAPTCAGGTALWGELDKVTTISTQRFTAVQCTPSGAVAFTLVGQPSETVRVGYTSGGALLFFAHTFPPGPGPTTAACSVGGGASGGCSSQGRGAAPALPLPPSPPVHLRRAGSGLDVVAGATARVVTPVNTVVTGALASSSLPTALVEYVHALHRHVADPLAARRSLESAAASHHAASADADPLLAPLYDLLSAAMASVDPLHATQDCMAFALAYEYALRVMPSRAPHREVWDALRLGPNCGATPPPSREELGIPAPWPPVWDATHRPSVQGPTTAATPAFYVSPGGSDVTGDGSLSAPFATVVRGVNATRAARAPGAGPASLILRAGLHVLGQTVQLDARDVGLTISNYPGEAVYVSGGAPIGPLTWTPVNVTFNSSNVYAAHVSAVPQYLTSLVTINGTDGSPSKRLYRAQYPNFNPELSLTGACGGGDKAASRVECVRDALASPFILETARRLAAGGSSPWLAAGSSQGVQDNVLLEWVPPPPFPKPQLVFRDLQGEGLKNDSTMSGYNQYAVGRGGACGVWTNAWPADSSLGWDYHCGNISQGGWENVDGLMYSIGQLNLPYGAVLSTTAYPNSAKWKPNVDPTQRDNGAAVVNVWHTQSWFNNAFFVTGLSAYNSTAVYLNMSGDGVYPLGGWQGGRHWETYGSFHGGGPEGPLLGGAWWVSNLFEELDSYDEFYFDSQTDTLYVFWNASSTAGGQPFSPPPANTILMAPQLEVLFNISGTSDVTLAGLGFRDQRGTMMEPWVVPSGGDWGLRPAGAVNVWDCERVTVSDALFTRTDGNAVFLGSYNRNVSVLNTEFAWIGMSAVASLGLTDFDDGTAGTQPWGTVMAGLYAHEIGLVEKQSSVFFSGRTPLARMESSIMYNGPRAMININDSFGGGSNFTRNLMFNTCRESGDHGAQNSWARMPLSSNLTGTASYMGQINTETSLSLGLGNYGASQVFDNDDGSNHFHTHHNFFYQSDGVKGDYGPHDSIFESNVIIGRAFDGQNCVNSAPFVAGHQHVVRNNTCVVMAARNAPDLDMVIQGAGGWCSPAGGPAALMVIEQNAYYTTHGNASVKCGQTAYGVTINEYRAANPSFEAGSTFSTLPSPDQVIQWGRDVLGL